MSRKEKKMPVPRSTALLYPEVPEGVSDKSNQRRQKAESYHDSNVKALQDLDIGQEFTQSSNSKRQVLGQRELPTEAF